MNFRLLKDFKKYLEEASKPKTTYSSYGGGSSTYASSHYNFTPKARSYLITLNDGHEDFRECGRNPINFMDVCNVFFYEFSSTDKGCRHYNSASEFFAFLGEYGIKMNDVCRNAVKVGSAVWVSCIPNRKEAFVRRNRNELKTFLEKHQDPSVPISEKEKGLYYWT